MDSRFRGNGRSGGGPIGSETRLVSALQTVFHDGEYPSRVALSLVPRGSRRRANRPCRKRLKSGPPLPREWEEWRRADRVGDAAGVSAADSVPRRGVSVAGGAFGCADGGSGQGRWIPASAGMGGVGAGR